MSGAGEVTTARDALVAWFLHEWWEDTDVPAAELDADHLLTLLRALPVDQRMEAMGMERVTYGWGLGVNDQILYREPGSGTDG